MGALIERLWRKERPILAFALLGAASGSFAICLMMIVRNFLAGYPRTEIARLLTAGSVLLPGIIFGLFMGLALVRRGIATWPGCAAYCAASTGSYFAAFAAAVMIFGGLGSSALTGMVGGLVWAAGLTAAGAAIFPSVRRPVPCRLMVLSGCLLGILLGIVDHPDVRLWDVRLWDMVAIFAAWQAGYAAAFATALPKTGGEG